MSRSTNLRVVTPHLKTKTGTLPGHRRKEHSMHSVPASPPWLSPLGGYLATCPLLPAPPWAASHPHRWDTSPSTAPRPDTTEPTPGNAMRQEESPQLWGIVTPFLPRTGLCPVPS